MTAPDWIAPDWIALDWGTTHLRAYAMRGAEVLASAASGDGMGQLAPGGFEPALLRLVAPWLGPTPMPVIACGMVGARQGWCEAPYRTAPCAPVAVGETLKVATQDARLAVEIVPGLAQPAPADVMRGEETQIAGFLALEPGFEGTLLLPGTHSKHVTLARGQVQAFCTHLTGELFAALSAHTVLRHSLGGEGDAPEAFAEGVRAGAAGHALRALFALRAENLLAGLAPHAARSRLSGLLIGAELAGLAQGGDLVIIGSGALAARYNEALAVLGHEARVFDGEALVCQGLALARGERA